MKGPRFVVLATRVVGFDSYEEAAAFAQHNYPAVICERVRLPDGSTELRERARFDRLYDEERDEWRIMLG